MNIESAQEVCAQKRRKCVQDVSRGHRYQPKAGKYILCKINLANDFVCVRPTISGFWHYHCIDAEEIPGKKKDQSQRLY